MANTKVTGDLIASSTIATGNIADNAVTSDKISGITTAHITEGSNLYYTDARARGAVSVSGNALAYNSSTGVITSNFEESPAFTGAISAVGASTFTLNDGIFIKAVNGTNNIASTNVWGYGLYEGTSKLGEVSLVRDGSNSQMYIGTTTANQVLRIGSANKVTAITINASQNVGIGMTSPSNKLEVAGDVAINTSSNSRLRFYQGGTFKAGIQAVDTGGQMIGSSAANDLAIRSQSNMLFSTGGNTERMRIFSNGNVNIGVAEAGASAVTGPFVVTHTSSRFLTSSYEESAVSLSAKNGNNNLETLRLAGDSIKFFNGTNAVGSQKMVILNNGNVGIGTTSPGNLLDVAGDTDINGQLFVTHDANYVAKIKQTATSMSNGAYTFEIDSTSHTSNMSTAGAMSVDVNSGRAFTINGQGNVGIGTTSPEKKLSIGSSQSNGIQFTYDTGNNYRNQILNYWNSNTDSRMDFNIARTNGQTPQVIMSVGYGGNVGIGTTSPTSKLTIDNGSAAGGSLLKSSSSSYTAHFIANTSTGNAGIYCDASNGDFIGSDYVFFGQHDDKWAQISSGPSASGIRFMPADSIRMVINNSGNVGIGTTSPNKKLVVAQSNVTEPSGIDANTSILIKNNTWSGISLLATSDTGSFITFGDNDAGFRGRIQYTHSNDNMVFETAAGERMRIENDGDVILTEGNLTMSGNTPFIVLSNTAETESGITFVDSADASQSAKITFNSATDNLLKFYNNASNARMTIDSSGKVGIGTTPTEMLHIKGGGSGPEIRLEGTWGSHYIRAYNDNWNFLAGGTVQAINIKNNGSVQMGTTNSAAKLNVGGPILASDNNQSAGMYVRRSLNLSHPGGSGTFTRTFNPVTQFGISRLGGHVLLEVSGWSQRVNCGYIQFQNAGGGGNITTVTYTQIAVQGNGSISVSVNSANDNSIDINFSGWHGNSHAFLAKIVTQ